ncbi:HDOD domain-containing protein [Acidovorax radicis]|jgi:putative nucleotidyltransferase with HDIG domain|uniref:HDOD domain-containing protein n=1 Tax=Acidovorax radicis TaxID=758826 RepID=UPI001CF89AAA|nr:HDOD domain-containing protein [Acidovorax radicis]UCU98122.1 HDOD domain-containing protein [Acidovorax radicis]
MNALTVEGIRRSIRELPALPAVVLELIQSFGDSHISAEQLAAKISHDQAIAAKTLRLANSSFYGLPRQVTSIPEATTILGLRTLRSVATAAGVVGGFSSLQCPGFHFEAFWRHSIATAITARTLAQRSNLDEDTAFTMGLLHDIGRLVLVSSYESEYAQAIAYQLEHDCLMHVAERLQFGVDHADVGGVVAEHWHFAPEIVAAISDHHRPQGARTRCLGDLLHVADNIAHGLDLSRKEDDMVPLLGLDAWARMALSGSDYLDVFDVVEQQHESVCAALLA